MKLNKYVSSLLTFICVFNILTLFYVSESQTQVITPTPATPATPGIIAKPIVVEPKYFFTIPGETINGLTGADSIGSLPRGGYNPRGGNYFIRVSLPINAFVRQLRATICDGEPNVDVEVRLYDYVKSSQTTPQGIQQFEFSRLIANCKTSGYAPTSPTLEYLSKPQRIKSSIFNSRVIPETNLYVMVFWQPAVYIVIRDIQVGYDIN